MKKSSIIFILLFAFSAFLFSLPLCALESRESEDPIAKAEKELLSDFLDAMPSDVKDTLSEKEDAITEAVGFRHFFKFTHRCAVSRGN